MQQNGDNPFWDWINQKLMRRIITLLAVALPGLAFAQAPCNTTNATGCSCAVPGQTNCDLLPDITVSDYAILYYNGGPTEFSQTGNGADDGRLRVSSSTPNIGLGSFTVGSVSMWTCGNDTFTTFPGTCPGGVAPKQLIKQKIYHKNGGTMTFTERWAGSMTYHPSHGHMHVDDWCTMTLRVDNGTTDTLNWPIVGTGAKVGFCLMDFGTCTYYNGHCEDDMGNVLTGPNFPNYGLGGGSYNCSPVEQGISSGYTDIYGKHLDGMWVNIPPGTCNGNYWIVIEADPNNNFLESNENNNWAAVPYTLTQQVPAGSNSAAISTSGPTDLCPGEAVTLTANAGSSYVWSTGATTQSITVTAGGSYTVTVTSPCGTGVATPITVTAVPGASVPVTQNDTVCANTSATLTAASSSPIYWYNAPSGGTLVGSGTSFITPSLASTTTYYAESESSTPGTMHHVGPLTAAIGSGAYHANATRYLTFDASQPFTLKSVWVDAQTSGSRVIELRNGSGFIIATATVNVPAGQSRITLNFNVPQGTNMQLGTGNTPNMWRSDGGVAFPYSVANVATITGSSAGSQYYYFFYDWEIETLPRVCVSSRTPATAVVNAAASLSISGLASSYDVADPAVSLTGSPAGGTFSGPGVSGNTFNPALAGTGGPYTITYTYTDGQGCISSITQQVTVTQTVSILDTDLDAAPMVYPNPTEGIFTVKFELDRSHVVELSLLTLTGERVMVKQYGPFNGIFQHSFDLRQLPSGVYLVQVKAGDRVWHQKLIFQ